MKFLSSSNEQPVVLPIWSKRQNKLSTSTRKKSNNDNNYCKSLHAWRKTSVLKTLAKTRTIHCISCDKSGYHPKKQTTYLKSNFKHFICICMMWLNLFMSLSLVAAIDIAATTPMQSQHVFKTANSLPNEQHAHWMHMNETRRMQNTTWQNDSIFMRLKQQISSGNELWDGIIRDCYRHPTFTCFQKNVYLYLNDALSVQDVNITQSFKFYKNNVDLNKFVNPTESALSEDLNKDLYNDSLEKQDVDEHLLKNEIPTSAREFPAETPIEEVTNALYDKSVKFAMTHDVEIQMPEVMFDGATFRISPKSFEGNGVIAKLELIPKQQVEARLAGKIIMKKIQKFLKSKLLLSFLALLLIIKIIKIKLFWLLPLIVGVGAAKKLLLKFLLFLFPALSHLFKLCSYYQQTYHSTKYHHHHHLINHHHTIVPAWHHHEEHSSIPEVIYTHPPKGHVSAYLHGAPIHETYGPPAHEHYEGGWESSGPGLGSEYISDINRVAQIDDKSNYFKPHTNDANVINDWGLGTTSAIKQNKILQQQATQQQRPPIQKLQLQKQSQQQILPPQLYQRPHATSHIFNPYANTDKQSIYNSKYKIHAAQSAPSPVYYPSRNGENPNYAAQLPTTDGHTHTNAPLSDPQKQPISPEVAAQLREAIRRQTEQRIIAQQQKILEKQPFVQDGEPLVTKNYDPFYSPILVKIDKIVEQLGVKDDLCKARLICNMYRDPARFSPHSNFVSAELSRDTSELPQVSDPEHPAVMRFFRYIQAARDGQEQKNCLQLYPECNITTEFK